MIKREKAKLCLQLFSTFFKIGSFTFGGGFAMIPLIERDVVDKHKWMECEEFVDMIAVTQCAPGPVAVNSAVFVGYKLAGVSGAVATLLGVTLPSFLIILVLALFILAQGKQMLLQKFFMGVRPAVVALILWAGLKMGLKNIKTPCDYCIGAAGIVLLLFLNIHPIILIITAAVLGIVYQNLSAQGER